MKFYGWRQTKQQDKTTRQDNNSVELEASLAPAEAEVGAVAKADQQELLAQILLRYSTIYRGLLSVPNTLTECKTAYSSSFCQVDSYHIGIYIMVTRGLTLIKTTKLTLLDSLLQAACIVTAEY